MKRDVSVHFKATRECEGFISRDNSNTLCKDIQRDLCLDCFSSRLMPELGHKSQVNSNMAIFSRNNCETRTKTYDSLLKLNVVGLDSDPDNQPKNKWSKDIDLWPGIGFPDIYIG